MTFRRELRTLGASAANAFSDGYPVDLFVSRVYHGSSQFPSSLTDSSASFTDSSRGSPPWMRILRSKTWSPTAVPGRGSSYQGVNISKKPALVSKVFPYIILRMKYTERNVGDREW